MAFIQLLALGFTVLTYGSFIWAAEYYFVNQENANPADYRFIKIMGFLSMLFITGAQLFIKSSEVESAIGCILLLISFALLMWSIQAQNNNQLDFAFTSNTPTFLNTSGPYAIVRHPIYLSYILGWIGGAIASGYYILLISAVIMGRRYLKAIRLEERMFSESALRYDYENYCKKTKRLIPLIY